MEGTETQFWSRCEGDTAGSYRLGKSIEESAGSATFWTEHGADARPALIKLFHGGGMDDDARLQMWRGLAQMAHPRLVRVLDAGRGEIGGAELIWIVLEPWEGNLANVLPERRLTTAEAGEMVEASVDALSWLHGHGLAHGAVSPANIVAVGDEIKLASDCITPGGAPEAAEDVRALGETITGALGDLPQPFLDIARHCLEPDPLLRWKIEQVRARLTGPQLVEPPPQNSRTRLYVIAAAAIGLILALLLLGRSERSEPAAPVRAQKAVVATPSAPPPPVVRPPAPGGNWAVVAAAYARRADAEKRAQRMTVRWPKFPAAVSGPPARSSKPYYLVILGARLSQDQAAALRERARSAGVARDAYITQLGAR